MPVPNFNGGSTGAVTDYNAPDPNAAPKSDNGFSWDWSNPLGSLAHDAGRTVGNVWHDTTGGFLNIGEGLGKQAWNVVGNFGHAISDEINVAAGWGTQKDANRRWVDTVHGVGDFAAGLVPWAENFEANFAHPIPGFSGFFDKGAQGTNLLLSELGNKTNLTSPEMQAQLAGKPDADGYVRGAKPTDIVQETAHGGVTSAVLQNLPFLTDLSGVVSSATGDAASTTMGRAVDASTAGNQAYAEQAAEKAMKLDKVSGVTDTLTHPIRGGAMALADYMKANQTAAFPWLAPKVETNPATGESTMTPTVVSADGVMTTNRGGAAITPEDVQMAMDNSDPRTVAASVLTTDHYAASGMGASNPLPVVTMQVEPGMVTDVTPRTVDVPLDKIVSMQPSVNAGQVESVAAAGETPETAASAVKVVDAGNGHYILEDGNHRVLAAQARGEGTIKATLTGEVADPALADHVAGQAEPIGKVPVRSRVEGTVPEDKAALAAEEKAAAAEQPVPEGEARQAARVSMPTPEWANRLADKTPDFINRFLGQHGMGLVDRFRYHDFVRSLQQFAERTQNSARNSTFMRAGTAASKIMWEGDKSIPIEQYGNAVAEEIIKTVNGEQMARDFARNTQGPVPDEVLTKMLDRAGRGYKGVTQEMMANLTDEQKAEVQRIIQRGVEEYKVLADQTMRTLVGNRYGSRGLESELLKPGETIMTQSDLKLYRRVMQDLRRERIWRDKLPGLVERAYQQMMQSAFHGNRLDDYIVKLQEERGINTQTMSDLHDGIPPGIKDEAAIEATANAAIAEAISSEARGEGFGSTMNVGLGTVEHTTDGYSASSAGQFDVTEEEFNQNGVGLVKEAIMRPKMVGRDGTYDPVRLWGGLDARLGIWKYNAADGTVHVAGDLSQSTINGQPLNYMQAVTIGEAFEQQAIYDNTNRQDVKLSGSRQVQALSAAYLPQISDPASGLNRRWTQSQEFARTLDPTGVKLTDPRLMAELRARMAMDHSFFSRNKLHKLGDLFNSDLETKPTGRAPRNPALYQGTAVDMSTADGIEAALRTYEGSKLSQILGWYHESHQYIEDTYRGKTMPITGRDAAETFYDVLAFSSVMASPLQNLGRTLMSFSNLEDLLKQHEDAALVAQQIMDRAMKLPDGVTYVSNIGKGPEGQTFGNESYGGDLQTVHGQRYPGEKGPGKGTPVSTKYFETPEFRRLAESTAMTTTPKYNIIDVLLGRYDLSQATNESIGSLPEFWTGTRKSLSDAGLPVERINYWAHTFGIDPNTPALIRLNSLQGDLQDLQAAKEGKAPMLSPEEQQTSQFISDQAAEYAKENKLPKPKNVDLGAQVNPVRGHVIADFYDKAESNPNDPAVVAAYDAFAADVVKQWEYLKRQGVTVAFVDRPESGGVYPNEQALFADVANKHLSVDRTGPGEEHLMPRMNEVVDHDAEGNPITTNDAFRAVHDYFGHTRAGNMFDRHGEDVAWKLHEQMFSKAAKPALFTETVGQNSYLNFHPSNVEARLNGGEAQFPDQKAALLPDKVRKANYTPTVTDARNAIREAMRDPSLSQAYEQAMMEHTGSAGLAKLRSFRSNLSDPTGSLSVTLDSVMAKLWGLDKTHWGSSGEYAKYAQEIRDASHMLSLRMGRTVAPHEVQALLWVYTKEFVGRQDWGRLLAHRDVAMSELDQIRSAILTNQPWDASQLHYLDDWKQEELGYSRTALDVRNRRDELKKLDTASRKGGPPLSAKDAEELAQLRQFPDIHMQPVQVDTNADARSVPNDEGVYRSDLANTGGATYETVNRHESPYDAKVLEQKRQSFEGKRNPKTRELEGGYQQIRDAMQSAVAEGTVEGVDRAKAMLDQYVAGWEKPIKGDAEGGNFRVVGDYSRGPQGIKQQMSAAVAEENLRNSRYVPSPNNDINVGTAHEVQQNFMGEVRGATMLDAGRTGRLVARLYGSADLGTLLHEDMHLLRMMAPGNEVAELQRFYPHIQDARLPNGDLTAPARYEEELFVRDFLGYLHNKSHGIGADVGSVPTALFGSIAETMGEQLSSWLNTEVGHAVPQDIVDYWDNIFNPEIMKPSIHTDPLSAQYSETPPGVNTVQRRWESDAQYAQRTRQYGEARQRQATIDAREQALVKQKARVDAATNQMLNIWEKGGEQGIKVTKLADQLAARAGRGIAKLDERMGNPSLAHVPPTFRPAVRAFQEMAAVIREDPKAGELAGVLAEIPQTFAQIVKVMADRGFEPTYVPEITWPQAERYLYGHLNLTADPELAAIRKENKGVVVANDAQSRTLEALASAQIIATKEMLQGRLIGFIEKYYAKPLGMGANGKQNEVPDGWTSWDSARSGIVQAPNKEGKIVALNAGETTSIIPKEVADAINKMQKRHADIPARFAMKGGATTVWKDVMLTYSPSWYIKHFMGTVITATLGGARIPDFVTAVKQAWSKDEFGLRGAELPDVAQGGSLWRQTDERQGHGPSDFMQRNVVEGAQMADGIREHYNNVRDHARNVVKTVDGLGRAAVYAAKLREGASAEFAADAAYRAIGDFGDLNPFERGMVTSIMPFYSFSKAMLKIVLRLPVDHPLAAGLFARIGQMNQQHLEELLGGPLPSNLIGSSIMDGHLTSWAKTNPLTDAVKNFTPAGIVSGLHPYIKLLLEQGGNMPGFNSVPGMGSFGQLVQKPNIDQELLGAFQSNPVVAQVSGKGWSPSQFFPEKQYTDAQWASLIKRLKKTRADIAKGDQGGYIINTVNLPKKKNSTGSNSVPNFNAP